MGKASVLNWSIFGDSPLVVEMSIPGEKPSVDSITHTFEEMGATVDVSTEDGFRCILPARKILGFQYRKRTGLECTILIHTGPSKLDTTVVATCDIGKVRRAKRTVFYALSVVAFLLLLPDILEKWNWTASLVLFVPLPIAELHFFLDRKRLREKLSKALRRAVGRD